MKIALVFGVTGQDGSYLSRFLLKKKKYGLKEKLSLNTDRIDDIYQEPWVNIKNLFCIMEM